MNDFERELAWARRHMPRLQRSLAALPDLSGVRLAASVHLDLKMAPLFEGLLQRGAQIFLVTCNPSTVRNETAAYLGERGVQVDAWRDMPLEAYQASIQHALEWQPTHLCEFGADLTASLHSESGSGHIIAGLEGTGSGISRLAGATPAYPIFNWDDLPVKEGLHNRHMVGLTTWHTFFNRTRLTLHEKQVAVIGYGLVGQGVAASARAYGGAVTIVERDPGRQLQAAYDGWHTATLEHALLAANVVVTATGARSVLKGEHLELLKDEVFILNVGHRPDEIDLPALYAYPHQEALPFVEAFQVDGRRIYLLAGGSMANLTAGEGDSLNAFDVTLAVMASGIGYIAGEGAQSPPGVYMLPPHVWSGVL